jgi:polyphosphate kinase 2 (PPK2 family)
MAARHRDREFERSLTNSGAVLVKFWLHISVEEQLRRFQEREEIEYKRYKITPEDWRNREKMDVYLPAVTQMLQETSTREAPWTIVEAEDKYWARVRTLRALCERLEDALAARAGGKKNRKSKKKKGD